MTNREVDPYLDPDTGVLRNRLGISDRAELERIEGTFAYLRSAELDERPEAGRFDLNHIQRIHHRLFGDVYEWAGQVRTVDISKGDSTFARVEQIERYAGQIARELTQDALLRGKDADQFSERAAYYLAELNALHPFREGNGRTGRQVIGQIAQEAGFMIHWRDMDRSAYLAASIESFHGDLEPLTRLIRQNLHSHARTQECRSADRADDSGHDREARQKAVIDRIRTKLAGRAHDDTGRNR